MNERSLPRRLLFHLSRPLCINCRTPLSVSDFAFCPGCSAEFKEKLNKDCSYCMKNLRECSCAPEFLRSHFVKKLYKSFRYIGNESDGLSASLIYGLKMRPRSDAFDLALDLMLNSLKNSGEDFSGFTVTNVPRRKGAIVEYGFDHSARLAKKIAKAIGAKYAPLLTSRAKREQKQLSRVDRKSVV